MWLIQENPNVEFDEAVRKEKIPFKRYFKDLGYCLSVITTSTLSLFVELISFVVNYSFILQIPNQAFNIKVTTIAIQILCLCKLPLLAI